jgi:BMFP domain-containing protein YqiC
MTAQSDEQYRHECEVRAWILYRTKEGKEALRERFRNIERKRSKKAVERLKNDFLEQWNAGNRGESGLWF